MQMQTYSIPMNQLEELTHLHFGNIIDGFDRTEKDAKAILAAGINLEPPSYRDKKPPILPTESENRGLPMVLAARQI